MPRSGAAVCDASLLRNRRPAVRISASGTGFRCRVVISASEAGSRPRGRGACPPDGSGRACLTDRAAASGGAVSFGRVGGFRPGRDFRPERCSCSVDVRNQHAQERGRSGFGMRGGFPQTGAAAGRRRRADLCGASSVTLRQRRTGRNTPPKRARAGSPPCGWKSSAPDRLRAAGGG